LFSLIFFLEKKQFFRTMSSSEDKKRKWDLTADTKTQTNEPKAQPATQPATQQPVDNSPQAVKSRITAILSTQGVASVSISDREIEINDCKPDTRYHLCKGTTHDELTYQLKATIKVRGKYKIPGDKSFERPLHLYITADTKEDLDKVVSKVEEIIKGDQNRKFLSMLMIAN
jgi:hypothetical protein